MACFVRSFTIVDPVAREREILGKVAWAMRYSKGGISYTDAVHGMSSRRLDMLCYELTKIVQEEQPKS